MSGAPDPRFSYTGSPAFQQTYLPWFRDLLCKQQWLEQMHDWREPIGHAILSHLRKQACAPFNTSYFAALRDWAILGELTGFQGICKPKQQFIYYQVHLAQRGHFEWTSPIHYYGLRFFDKHGVRLHTVTEINFAKLTIHWRIQKNGVNGQKIYFSQSQYAWLCPVCAGVRIVERFHCINPRHEDIAIHEGGLLTHSQVTQAIRMAVTRVYKLASNKPNCIQHIQFNLMLVSSYINTVSMDWISELVCVGNRTHFSCTFAMLIASPHNICCSINIQRELRLANLISI